ncbi:hypothetical protein ACWGQT_07385 [Streptomyces yangpuensis]
MTTKPATTARAAAVSRILTTALADTGIRRGSVSGYTVRQYDADVVRIEWNAADGMAEAFEAITTALQDRYDVQHTTVREGSQSSYAVAVLNITPGTPIATTDGDNATDADITAPSYVYAWPGNDFRTRTTAQGTRDAIASTLADNGAATIDRTTGVITLHIGKARDAQHTLTPSTPEDLATHRKELTQALAHWNDQVRRANAEADRKRTALPNLPDDRHHFAEIQIRTRERQAAIAQENADKAQADLDSLTAPAEPLEAPVTQPAPAEDTITVRVPGAFARLWDLSRADDRHELDAALRDVATAWANAPEKDAGKGTVRVLTCSRQLAAQFAWLVRDLAHAESDGSMDSPDVAAAKAGWKLLERLADMGIRPEDARDDYRMADPAAQAALEAEQAQAAERKREEEAQAAAEEARTAAWRAMDQEERAAHDARVLALALEHLGAPAPEGRRSWTEHKGLTISVLRGALSVEPDRAAWRAGHTASLDAARATLLASGWNNHARNDEYISATHPSLSL